MVVSVSLTRACGLRRRCESGRPDSVRGGRWDKRAAAGQTLDRVLVGGSVAGSSGLVDSMQTAPGWSWDRLSQNRVMKADGGNTPGAGGGSAGGLSKYKKLAPSFRNGGMGPMHAQRRSVKAACGRPGTATAVREQLANRPCVCLDDGCLVANGPGRMVATVVMAQWGFRASAASGEAGLPFGYQQEFPQSGPQFRRDWQGAVDGLRHGRKQEGTRADRGSRGRRGGGDCEPLDAVAVQVDRQTWCIPTREATAPSCEDEGKGGDCRSGVAGRELSRSRREVGERADPSGARRASGRVGEWVARAGSLSGVCRRTNGGLVRSSPSRLRLLGL